MKFLDSNFQSRFDFGNSSLESTFKNRVWNLNRQKFRKSSLDSRLHSRISCPDSKLEFRNHTPTYIYEIYIDKFTYPKNMHTHIHTYIHSYIHTYICLYARRYIVIHACMHACKPASLLTLLQSCLHTC